MHATLHHVCKRARVSTATVSRVLNGSPLVHEKTRTRVLKIIEALDYRPSHAARTLARARTDALAVIFPQIASGFFTEVLRGMDEVGAEHNFHLMTAFSHGRRDEQELVLRMLRERRADALVLMNLGLSDEFIKRAAKHKIPIVLIDRPEPDTKLCAISMDNVGGADAAMTHLLEHGYREVAFITGPRDNYDAEQRLAGCQQAAARFGVALAADLIWPGEFTEESGRLVMARWLDGGHKLPEAIFACNDVMAIGALNYLQESGYAAPRDVAVVGFDDIDSARHLGLTSVRVPMHAMGRAAAEAAIQQVLSGEAQPQRVLPTSLVVRRSCGCRATTETVAVDKPMMEAKA